ncbi:PREDICTED: protein abrupt [Dinoponera quadriceps]|uniref:Protein abrupt n=1 Tax=Dinoponera quadriceps TaxID=609295 RepID=A0A6P3Y185_DINQU|nr:PREDICTED: protein abrupt [Dinoponera quadriceps]XP_014483954.1 PREDICTED: protein abrupt [Dinoponera quadriceps]XP_014483955.1 PREDICTED: protein abrupt [Dinoponera quadriceps]
MESQQFCLRWHNFQNTLLSSLPKLLDGGHLTDVTLSAGGRHIHAHRIILSACSYYFKELFKDLNSLQHPVIVLPGMEYANLCALVTFMYNGEVNIYQEQLPALLAMADTLHIRGLADIAGKNARHDNGLYVQPPVATQPQEKKAPSNEMIIKKESKDNNIASVESPAESMSAPLLPEITDNLDDESSNDRDSIPYCVKTKPYYSINAKLNQREKVPPVVPVNASGANKYLDKAYPESGVDETTPVLVEDRSITPVVEDVKPPPSPAVWDANFKFLAASSRTAPQTYNKSSVTCLICGKQLSNQYNLRVHMETHSNSSYSCAACSHVSRSRDALRKHVSYRHPVTPPQKRTRYSTSKP